MMKNIFSITKVIVLTTTLFTQSHVFAPLKPLDRLPDKFLPYLTPMTYEWPTGHKNPPALKAWGKCIERPRAGQVNKYAKLAPLRQAYKAYDDDLARAEQVLCFWIKPYFMRGSEILSEAEAILIPVNLIREDRLNLSKLIDDTTPPLLNIKLYKDEQLPLPETMEKWRTIVALNFMYFLIGEDTRILMWADARFPSSIDSDFPAAVREAFYAFR